MRAGLRNETFQYIEGMLKTFKQYPEWIKEREQSLMYPHKEIDENVGGGKSSNTTSPTELIVTRLLMDKQLSELCKEYNAMQYAFESCVNDNVKQIIELYYIKRTHTWKGVADLTNYSEKQCQRLRDGFIKQIADYLGRT